MPVQTSYSREHAPAYEGMKASTSELYNSRSYFAEGGNIRPGLWVVTGTDGEKQVTLPATDSEDEAIKGLTMYELNRVHTDAGAPENEDRPLSVVNHGPMWVIAIDGASVDDPVFAVRAAAGGVIGGTRSAEHGAEGVNTILVSNAKFISAASAGGLAKIAISRS